LRQAFWAGLAGELAAGHAVFLAIVIRATDHSPGTRGAALWLSASGRREGTIGGGIMELRLEQRAKALLATPEPFFELKTLVHRRDLEPEAKGERSGLICAGEQTNLYRLCLPTDAAAFATVADAVAADRQGWLCLDAGGPRLNAAGDPEAPFCVPLRSARRLAIFGGGHCGQALACQMRWLGWDVEIVEVRPNLLRAELAVDPALRWRQVADYREGGSLLLDPAATACVVMTTDFPSDVRALHGLRGLPFPCVGVMGSAAKIAEIKSRLRAEGWEEAELAALRAPVGLPIGSHTPAEIAVSIAAQLLGAASPGRSAG
jgi:xanthine dehydrogenase accessory factor